MVNEWTRDDLPDTSVATDKYGAIGSMYFPAVDDYRDAVVAHLNANGGLPTCGETIDALNRNRDALVENRDQSISSLQRLLSTAESDRDRLRRAHSVVEGERDQARASLHEACKLAQSYKVDAYQATERAEAAERELDEWRARAEKAERELVPTAPPDNMDADPVVFVVRESDLPDVERDEDGDWLCENLVVNGKDTAEDVRGRALSQLEHVAMREAVARAIEAGQATDPVEELAGQIETATRAAIRQVCNDLADVVPSLDPLTVERAMEVTAASRKVAAHVLGQEGRHVDQ